MRHERILFENVYISTFSHFKDNIFDFLMDSLLGITDIYFNILMPLKAVLFEQVKDNFIFKMHGCTDL